MRPYFALSIPLNPVKEKKENKFPVNNPYRNFGKTKLKYYGHVIRMGSGRYTQLLQEKHIVYPYPICYFYLFIYF